MAGVTLNAATFPGKEHRTAITLPEFKRWVKQFDMDHDGRISRKDLREAIRRRGAWFPGLRALFAVRRADRNGDGFVDESEIEGLIDFAERELGFRITTDDAAVPPRLMSGYGHRAPTTTTYQQKSNNSSDDMTYHSPPSSSVHSISATEVSVSLSPNSLSFRCFRMTTE